jgi:hypothetical protein
MVETLRVHLRLSCRSCLARSILEALVDGYLVGAGGLEQGLLAGYPRADGTLTLETLNSHCSDTFQYTCPGLGKSGVKG